MTFVQEEHADKVPEILDELSQLSYEDLIATEFYAEVLGRISSLYPVGYASAWLIEGTRLKQACRIGEARASDETAIFKLVEESARSGQARLIVPGASQADVASENPTPNLLAISAVVDGDRRFAVIQMSLPRDLSSQQQEGCFRLLTIVSDIAANYHRNLELAQLREQRLYWQAIDRFAASVNGSLSPADVSFLIANDGRQVIGCDRLLLLENHGSKYRLRAVSGLDTVNRRSNLVRGAELLASRVATIGELFEYPSESPWPEPLSEVVEAFVDESGTSQLVAMPLREPQEDPDDSDAAREEIVGVLIAENFSGDAISRNRFHAVARHSQRALQNVRQHQRVFLLPLWAMIGNMAWVVRARTWPKLLVAVSVLATVLLGAVFVPADFNLAADGTLQPTTRNYIFAPDDGVVDRLHVDHRSRVQEGDLVASLQSFAADLKLEEVQGELDTTVNKLRSVRTSRTDTTAGSLTQLQLNQLAAEEEELVQWQTSLQRQLALLQEHKKRLEIRAPIAGEVITWDLRNLLTARPVMKGQILMTVADLNGDWQLELHLPDRRIGHLRDAQRESSEPLGVSFILATDPGSTFRGILRETDDVTSVDDAQTLGLRVVVDIDEDEISRLRAGAKVMAQIECGRRSIGYVWLHELFEFVQSRILFRLF